MVKKNIVIGSAAVWALLALLVGPAWAQEKPIKLGVMFVSSGPMGGYGKHGFQAVQLAMDEINAAGGILGRKVTAVTADSKMQPPLGVEIAKRYILQEKVDFIVGPTSSGVAAALSPLMTEHKMILVLTQAAADSLTGAQFNPYMFSTLSNAMMHARAGAYFVADKPYKRWMCIGPNYNYGWDSWASFKSKLKELRPDVEFVGELWPKLTERDYTEFIKKIADAGPDAVWEPLWGMDAVNFIRQALPTKLFDKIKFAFPDGAALETLAPLGKAMPEGVYAAARYFFLTPDSEMNRKFVKSYYDRFKEWPDYMAEETYAGIYFIKAAVERAGTTDAEKVIKAVEREPLAWETPEGWKIMRARDHSVVEDVVWGETGYSDKYGFAILKNMQAIQAEQICRTPEELKEVRASYEKRLKGGK
jgi:branched-chain amino acid transport system substrate-binding protein